jgi:hypothetical protein
MLSTGNCSLVLIVRNIQVNREKVKGKSTVDGPLLRWRNSVLIAKEIRYLVKIEIYSIYSVISFP